MSPPPDIDFSPPSVAPRRRPKAPKLTPGKIDGVIDSIVQGDDIERLVANLSPQEQALFWEQIASLREGHELALDDLWRIDYRRTPPTIAQFIEDDYWIGAVCRKSEDSEGLFPAWREVLKNDFDLDSRIHNIVVTGSLGIGKCSPRGTEVIMFDGSLKKVENIVAGDLLMGDDSTPRRVVAPFSGRGKMYEIYPAKGEPFRVSEDHMLCLKTSTSDEITEVTVKDFLTWDRHRRDKARIYRVGVEWAEKEVPLDPYWLGLWLGDGSSCRIEIVTMDNEIRDHFVQYGLAHGCVVRESNKDCKAATYTLTTGQAVSKKTTNPLRLKLQQFGMCHSDPYNPGEKHIPQIYLANSRRVRLQLLAGLIDTDGCKNAMCSGVYDITFKSKRLADGTVFLARSLGYYAHTSVKIVNATAYYRITLSGVYDLPSKLKRKQVTPPKPSNMGRYGKSRINPDPNKSKFAVIPLEDDDYFGFELDGNHRYLLRDFTVTHNSFISVLLILYKIAIARCMRNPQSFLGLAKGSAILYVLLSVTKSSVAETVFGDAKNFMSNSPFFMEECKFSPAKKYAGMHIPLGENIFLTAGSRGQHILGRNTMGVVLDEGNWRIESNPDTKAYELFNEVRHRLTNRFQRISGYLPALSILASSARDESSTTESVINEIRQANNPHTEKVYRFAAYQIKHHAIKHGSRWFKVEYGIKNVDPRVLSGWYTEAGDPIGDMPHEPASGEGKVELIPEDYNVLFKRSVKTALQSVCGISTGGSHRLFGSTEALEKAVALGRAAGLVDPCKTGTIALSDEDTKQAWDFLTHPSFLTRRRGQVVPLRDPDAKRYVHIDLATANAAGVAICHPVGTKLVTGAYNAETGQIFDTYRKVIAYDFILCITAGQSKPISLKKIQDFLFWLRDYCGFVYGKITADTYQSAMPLQIFQARGIDCGVLSLDRTKLPYYAWRSGFDESRILMFHHDILMHEAEHLIDHPNGKIDHPDKTVRGIGTKDVADACAGAFYNAMAEDSASSAANPGDIALHSGGERRPDPAIIMMPPVPPPAVHTVVV